MGYIRANASAAEGIAIYETPDGKRPFQEWIDSLKDHEAQGRVLARLERVRLGLLGDCKSVGNGVSDFDSIPALVIGCISGRRAVRS